MSFWKADILSIVFNSGVVKHRHGFFIMPAAGCCLLAQNQLKGKQYEHVHYPNNSAVAVQPAPFKPEDRRTEFGVSKYGA
jgi:hypothetical protein